MESKLSQTITLTNSEMTYIQVQINVKKNECKGARTRIKQQFEIISA